MIRAGMSLTLASLPLSQLHVVERECWQVERVLFYLKLLQGCAECEVDPILVEPDQRGGYAIQNGKHRYAASVLAGRVAVWCIIMQEKKVP